MLHSEEQKTQFHAKPAERMQMKVGDNVWVYLRDTIQEIKREQKDAEHAPINASIGMPTFSAPQFVLDAGTKAINDGFNQYVDPRGAKALRDQLASIYSRRFNKELDADKHVQATRGSAGAFDVVARAFLNAGDEVVILEPIWNFYVLQSVHFGGTVKSVRLDLVQNADDNTCEWKLDTNKLKNALNDKTKFLVFNTPHNPTGFILPKSQMKEIEHLLLEKYPQIIVITDEVYEHMVFTKNDDKQHYSMASISDAMWRRSITISSASKTFSVTGWRIGWIIANKDIIKLLRPAASAHCGGGCHPLEVGIANTLQRAELEYQGKKNYYVWLQAFYMEKYKLLKEAFESNGFAIIPSESTYFMLVEVTEIVNKLLKCGILTAVDADGQEQEKDGKEKVYNPDWQFVKWVGQQIGVLFAPCSAFDYDEPDTQRYLLRVSFCIKDDDISQVKVRLNKLREILKKMEIQ